LNIFTPIISLDGATTLSVTTLSVTPRRIIDLILTPKINIVCHYAEFRIVYYYAKRGLDKCRYAECHYAKCHYAECHYTNCHFIMVSVVVLCVIVLNIIIMLSVVILSTNYHYSECRYT
jgi:hypothetical protein